MTQNFGLLMQKTIGKIHFIGIGGIGMSGIAEILHNLGYDVQGSDSSENYNTRRLGEFGIKIFKDQNKDNIKYANVIVKSTAVKDDNPEIIEAKSRNIPIVKRSEMLAEIMRLKISVAISGTHGKTTTTSLTATMFEAADLDPTVINGGIINSKNTNAYLGKGDYLIAEADESDATFIKIPSTIGIITNIDAEHLSFYGSFENLYNAFVTFIENLPFYGFGVLCIDHDVVRKLSKQVTNRKIITYGIESEDADVKAINISQDVTGSTYDIILSEKFNLGGNNIITGLHLPTAGIHNVLNSLAAIAVAVELNFSFDIIKSGFKKFTGVKRRFTLVDKVDNITIIDDYAHHPIEIIAILKTAKSILPTDDNKVIAIVQPHRYSRVNDLFNEFINCFNDADILIMSEIYSAGEEIISGISRDSLVASIKEKYPNKEIFSIDNPDEIAPIIVKNANEGDIVIFLGAGDVTNWAYKLPSQL